MSEASKPKYVWLRVAGGGVTLPSGAPYTTMVGDDRELPGHTEYVRPDIAQNLLKALEFICDGYANQDVNHVDYRVKTYEVALEAVESAAAKGSQP